MQGTSKPGLEQLLSLDALRLARSGQELPLEFTGFVIVAMYLETPRKL